MHFLGENDFNTSTITETFQADEGGNYTITYLNVSIPIFDDDIDEANDQFFITTFEVVSAVNPALITLDQIASRCQIIDNDRECVDYRKCY